MMVERKCKKCKKPIKENEKDIVQAILGETEYDDGWLVQSTQHGDFWFGHKKCFEEMLKA